MKAHVTNLVIGIFVLGTLLSFGCGGDGDGLLPTTPGGTFTRTVELGSSPSNWGVTFDDDSFHISMRVQHLYRAQDMDGSGYIDSISFRYYEDESTAVTCSNVTIKMGHTSSDFLVYLFADNVEEGRGTHREVLSHATVVIPPGAAGDYFTIPLSKQFYYNGVDNLVVEITRDGSCTGLAEIMVAQASSPYTATIVHPADSGGAESQQQNNYLPDAKFHFSGGSNRLEYTGSGSVSPNTCPFNTTPQTQKAQFLHLASDINGSGAITGVAMRVGAQTFTEYEYTFTMRLGHTSLGSLTTDFNGNFNRDAPVTVADARVFKVFAGVLPWQYLWIPMPDGEFVYNGTNNLIVEIDVSKATGNTFWYQHESISASHFRALGQSGSSTALGTNTMQHQTKLRFKGDRISAITPNGISGGASESFPFSTMDGKIQFLYLAPELGTRGTIAKLACRAFSDSVNDSYSYTIRMSHTTETALSTNFADNLSDPVTVFSGIYSISSCMLKGDWFEIPLSTSFYYNGSDNLVVEIAGFGGSSNSCVVDMTSTTLYHQRRLIGGSSDVTGDNSSDYMIDTQFFLQD